MKIIRTVSMTAITAVDISGEGAFGPLCFICASAVLIVTGSTAVSRTVTSAPMISQYQEVTSVSARAQRFICTDPMPNPSNAAAAHAGHFLVLADHGRYIRN